MALKAREIREKLQGKIDPLQISIMCQLAEEQGVQKQTMLAIADAYDRLATMFAQVVSASNKLTPEGIKAALMGTVGKTGSEIVKSYEPSDTDGGDTK